MSIDEDLIREALIKTAPGDLDAVLTAIEAYRICTRTAQRLRRSRVLSPQRTQALECAAYCARRLTEYATTGRMESLRYPEVQFGEAELNLAVDR